MNWYYKGELLQDDMIPTKAVGFIYKMVFLPTSQQYIGRKLLTKSHRRRRKGKIIRSRIESDWRTYQSSSPEIHSLVEQHGEEMFLKEILMFANSKSHLNYLEEKFLYGVGAMESNHFINGNIRSKVFKRNIIDKLDLEEANSILKQLQQSIEGSL